MRRTCRPEPTAAAHAGETREGYYQPLERAELVRPGRDVTILCYSRMRYVVMQAVQQLEKQGYDPEVRRSLPACCCLPVLGTCVVDAFMALAAPCLPALPAGVVCCYQWSSLHAWTSHHCMSCLRHGYPCIVSPAPHP